MQTLCDIAFAIVSTLVVVVVLPMSILYILTKKGKR